MYIRHHEPESRLRRSAVVLSLVGAILFPLAGYMDWGKGDGQRGTPGVLEISGISTKAMWDPAIGACRSSSSGQDCPTILSRETQDKGDQSNPR
ncbi:MAG: hypothetical protein ACYCYP_10055 [Leptospirales bacterium]